MFFVACVLGFVYWVGMVTLSSQPASHDEYVNQLTKN